MKQKMSNCATKGDKTRQRIIETAAEMMAEKGPDAVSMREISAQLKITKPVLYYYFKDKNELIKAAFTEGSKHFAEMMEVISKPGLTMEQRLTTIFTNHLEHIKRYPNLPKCAMKIMSSPEHSILHTMAMEIKRRNRVALMETLKNSSKKEGISRADMDLVVHMISAVISYFMIDAKEIGTAKIPAALPARLAHMITRGVRSTKVILLALAFSSLAAAGAKAASLDLTLDAAVGTALKNNTTVTNAEQTRLIYKEKVNEYWGSVYPQLSASMGYTRNIESPVVFFGGTKVKYGLSNAYSASLNLTQVLWAGGKVATGIKMADLYAKQSDEQLKTAQKDITKSVKQMYYSVLLAKSMAGIQKETLDLARQHLATIEAQYKQGIASDLEVLRQKVEVSNTEPALTQAQNTYEEGLIELKNQLGLDPETDIALTDGFTCGSKGPGEISDLYTEALQARPEYRDMKYQRDLARETIKIERAGHFPYLSASASRSFSAQSETGFPGPSGQSWSTAAGVSLSLPLFSGGSVTSRTNQAQMLAEIAETNMKELERAVKIQVKEAWLSMKEASQRLQSQSTAVDQARQALAATETRFKNGLSSQLELNDTSLALNKSQTLYTQALHDTCSAGAELDWTLGK
jgi:outer membrane protein TolC/DNA-binding transcriptional regulator YbjK